MACWSAVWEDAAYRTFLFLQLEDKEEEAFCFLEAVFHAAFVPAAAADTEEVFLELVALAPFQDEFAAVAAAFEEGVPCAAAATDLVG